MTTEMSEEYHGEDDCPPPRENDPNCDPHLIDELGCKAKGVAAQAVYNATYQSLLDQAKIDFDTTRKAYRSARHDAALQVQDMRHHIKHLIERIKCLIEQKRVWRCLDCAFCEIVEELCGCETGDGCCSGECEFQVNDLDDLTWVDLVRRITKYQRHADENQACFTKLVAEPAALVQRVANAKAAIDAINAALSADPATTDLKVVYALALVANRDIERIWGGFDDANDFVDCLCRTLTCWTKGCAAVSILTGAKAVAECKKEAMAAHCDHLKTHTVDEIMAMYDKICTHPRGCDDEPTPAPPKRSSGCDECDEHHHHHHRSDGERVDTDGEAL